MLDRSKAPLQWLAEDYGTLKEEHRIMECMQRPGEVIYVPSSWGHAVLNLMAGAAIAEAREAPQDGGPKGGGPKGGGKKAEGEGESGGADDAAVARFTGVLYVLRTRRARRRLACRWPLLARFVRAAVGGAPRVVARFASAHDQDEVLHPAPVGEGGRRVCRVRRRLRCSRRSHVLPMQGGHKPLWR